MSGLLIKYQNLLYKYSIFKLNSKNKYKYKYHNSIMKFILNNHQPLLIRNPVSKPLITMNALNGLDIGIPLNIFSNIYTNLHYGYDITSVQSILIQFLLVLAELLSLII